MTAESKRNMQANERIIFTSPEDINIFLCGELWFEYPIHRIDLAANLSAAPIEGSILANLAKSGKRFSEDDQRKALDSAYEICICNGIVRVTGSMEYSGLSKPTVYSYIREFSDAYSCDKGIITRTKTNVLLGR